MGAAKWIGGLLGWVTFGTIGALIGFFLGSEVDRYIEASRQLPGGDSSGYDRTGGTRSQYQSRSGQSQYQSGTGQSQGSRTYTRQSGGYSPSEQRNSFYISLLVLSSAVMKADGSVTQNELDTVRGFFRTNFGEQAAKEAMQMLNRFNQQQVNIYEVGQQIAANMNYSQRLQLLHYLVSIATADGDFSKSEKSVLEAIASTIRLSTSDTASIISMFYRDKDSAYSVLEISPSATNDEVRTAYRKMAMKHHPDKVATLGPDVQKAAQEKFQKIQEAYETIKKERGIN